MDWQNKVSFFLSASELTQIAAASFSSELRFQHSKWNEDPAAARPTQVMSISPAASAGPAQADSWTLTISSDGGPTAPSSRSITLTLADLMLFRFLMTQSVTWVSGWQYQLDPSAFEMNLASLEERSPAATPLA